MQAHKEVRDMTLELCNAVRAGMTCAEVHDIGRKMWGARQCWAEVVGREAIRVGHGGEWILPSRRLREPTIIQ